MLNIGPQMRPLLPFHASAPHGLLKVPNGSDPLGSAQEDLTFTVCGLSLCQFCPAVCLLIGAIFIAPNTSNRVAVL
jgi:hypothetical protein